MFLKCTSLCPVMFLSKPESLRNGWMESSRGVISLSVLSLRSSRRCFSFSSHSNIVGYPWSYLSSTLTVQTLRFSVKWAHKRNWIANLCFKMQHKGEKIITHFVQHITHNQQCTGKIGYKNLQWYQLIEDCYRTKLLWCHFHQNKCSEEYRQ